MSFKGHIICLLWFGLFPCSWFALFLLLKDCFLLITFSYFHMPYFKKHTQAKKMLYNP